MNQEAMDLQRTPRERVWDAIRENRHGFTAEQVATIGHMKYSSAIEYVTGLEAAQFIRAIGKKVLDGKPKRTVNVYELINDVGNEAPRVRRNGELIGADRGTEAMWRSLRICGAQSAQVLTANASAGGVNVTLSTAKTYLHCLLKAGYLDVVKEARPNVGAVYRLKPTHNTGPKPPQIQRTRRVYDPNTGAVMYQEQPEFEEELRDGIGMEKSNV